ncbi:hypothetical protein EDC04DRAFT_2612464 [Pisolithus marmoratus]|nr:hypothetical protein EDC04DRAFT_2612464 [Pisolithus marmoratus]
MADGPVKHWLHHMTWVPLLLGCHAMEYGPVKHQPCHITWGLLFLGWLVAGPCTSCALIITEVWRWRISGSSSSATCHYKPRGTRAMHQGLGVGYSSQHYAAAQDVSQSSAMKGKSMLAQMKTDVKSCLDRLAESSLDVQYQIAMLKNEHKSMKMQAFILKKEITHLEMDNEKDHLEAEKIHCHMMESKHLDIQVLKGASEVLHLKLELVKIQSGTGISSANVNKSSDHPLPKS